MFWFLPVLLAVEYNKSTYPDNHVLYYLGIYLIRPFLQTSIMRTFLVAATLALASKVAAFPGRWAEWGNYGGGLNATGVQYLITGYTYLLEYPTGPNFNATANAILSDKFFVSSDSINTLSGRPVRTKLPRTLVLNSQSSEEMANSCSLFSLF